MTCPNINEPRGCWNIRCQLGRECVNPKREDADQEQAGAVAQSVGDGNGERCRYHVCDEADKHDPGCRDWVTGQEAAPTVTISSSQRSALVNLITAHLHGAYHCKRLWSSWEAEPMKPDDFFVVGESDTPAEIADAIIALAAPGAAIAAHEQEAPRTLHGEVWDDNPDGIVPGQERGPRMNPDTGFWEGAEADEEDMLADEAIAAGHTPGDSVPGVSTRGLVQALARRSKALASREEAPATPQAAIPATPSGVMTRDESAKLFWRWHAAYKKEHGREPTRTEAWHSAITQPTTVQQAETGDAAAEKLYTSFTDNHPTIHCNRFAPWSELGEAEKNTWRRKALKGMQPGERKEQS